MPDSRIVFDAFFTAILYNISLGKIKILGP
jgi:hypothetical protein